MVVLLRREDPGDLTGSAEWSGGRGPRVRRAPRSPVCAPLGLSPPAVAGVVGYSPAGSTVSVQSDAGAVAAVAAVADVGHNDSKRAATRTRTTTRSASS